MIVIRRLLAVVVLLALLGAGIHMALEHGGSSVAVHRIAHCHDHGDCPHGQNAEHLHDLNLSTQGHIGKDLLQSPQWIPLFELDLARLTALLRHPQTAFRHLPVFPHCWDERASGWLFVCRTALPARAPSLLA